MPYVRKRTEGFVSISHILKYWHSARELLVSLFERFILGVIAVNRWGNIFILLSWLMISVLSGFVTGCGEHAVNSSGAITTANMATGGNGGLDGLGKGPAPVLLGSAGDFVILAKSAVLTSGGSTVAGNLGVKPAVEEERGGLSSVYEPIQFSSAPQIFGHVFAAEDSVRSPEKLIEALAGMDAAYADAAGRKADFKELGAGIIGGMTLVPGTYNWSTALLIPSSITLAGGPNDVWIFQVAQGVVQASAARVILSGGARAKNIFWQVAGSLKVESSAHTEGVILSKGAITLGTGASANSRLLAQSTVSLDANVVTQPTP